MTKNQILTLVDGQLSWDKSDGDFRKKATVPQTFHFGKLSGNRLNSGTVRSQLIFCESLADWTDSDARKALHIDQRAFVQIGDDIWNVFRGVDFSERNEPVLWKENVHGLQAFLQDRLNLELLWRKSKDYESLFVDWLREFYVAKTGKLLAQVMIDRYYDSLKQLDQAAEFAGAGFPHVFSVRTHAAWTNFEVRIRAHAGFHAYNAPNSGAASAALTKYSEFLADSEIVKIIEERFLDMKRQKIVYGAPGTGKSFGLNTDAHSDDCVYRTTFHPDSDYSTFVGAYKPTMEEGKIVYKFRPQAFMEAYVAAWKEEAKGVGGVERTDKVKKPYPGLNSAMVNAVNAFIEEGGKGVVKTRKEIIAKAIELSGGEFDEKSFIPSDYCYNRVNGAMTLTRPALFEFLGDGRYKCLGADDTSYNGDILWLEKFSGEEK